MKKSRYTEGLDRACLAPGRLRHTGGGGMWADGDRGGDLLCLEEEVRHNLSVAEQRKLSWKTRTPGSSPWWLTPTLDRRILQNVLGRTRPLNPRALPDRHEARVPASLAAASHLVPAKSGEGPSASADAHPRHFYARPRFGYLRIEIML
jgi:hypothetical protein